MTRQEEINRAWGSYEVRSNHRYDEISFKEGAKWADRTMIEKACEMLYAMLSEQEINDYDYVTAPAYDNVVDFINDFRKAMEE